MRINRYIAFCTDYSRRGADELIKNSQVTVNDELLDDLSYQVKDSDTVKINGELIEPQHFVYYAVNKPVGYTSTTFDNHADKLVTELVPALPTVFPVGRLDKNSTGLIILTNDGEFSQKIQHPSFGHEKEYTIMTRKPFYKSDKEILKNGIKLEEGRAYFDDIKIVNNHEIRVVIHQGWKRQIRRMFSEIGFDRIELCRVRIQKLHLGNLKEGQYKIIRPEDVI